MTKSRWSLLLASVIFVGTALFHASGYPGVARAMETSGARPVIVSAVKGLWLVFSSHLILVGLVVLAVGKGSSGKQIILLCALISAIDTALLLRFVGVFAGTVLMAIATLLLFLGALLLRREQSTLRSQKAL